MYDIQLEAAQKIESNRDYVVVPEALEPESEDIHEIVVEKFDKVADEEEVRRMKENLFRDGARARGSNSKPMEKDYKGGESTRNEISI